MGVGYSVSSPNLSMLCWPLLQEESAFTGVASQCLSVLVLGINTHLDACLQVSPCYFL
jgi:hypothetical protein